MRPSIAVAGGVIVGTLIAATALAGCRGPDSTLARSPETTTTTAAPTVTTTAPSPTAPASGVPAGAPSPTGPPTFVVEPTTTVVTDQTPANTIVGTITAASTGPCYLLETDEGRQYALYGSGPGVVRGQRVKASTAPMTVSVDCGPGVQLRLVKLES